MAVFTTTPKAFGWTTTALGRIDVTLDIDPEGTARSTTRARFEVEGGAFHGFELADLPDAELDVAASRAVTDDGRVHEVHLERLKNGRNRLVLARGQHLGRGGVTFEIVHRLNLVSDGALRRYEGRARLSWTPIVWDRGADAMSVTVNLPGDSRDGPVAVDRDVARDYEHVETARSAKMTKYRPPRWYPMQVVLDFDPALIAGLPAAPAAHEPPLPMVAGALSPVAQQPRSLRSEWLPAVVAIIGLVLLALKARRVRRAIEIVGIEPRYRVLPRVPAWRRLFLSVAAIGLAMSGLWLGSLAASVPPLAVCAALWLVRREEGVLRPRAGGSWRPMDERDLALYRQLARAYLRSRRSALDATTLVGSALFAIGTAAVVVAAWRFGRASAHGAWSAAMVWLVLAVPVWFGHVRSELPLDPTLEGFRFLRSWRRPLARLIGSTLPGSSAAFWVREDGAGPVEVRLRVEPPPAGVRVLEIAAEAVRAGSTTRLRRAVVVRLDPDAEPARRLAALPQVVEHHLTPDLSEEVIVLRDRRGRRASGLAPLRRALAALAS